MTITHLERRRIEAGVLIPMLEAFQRAFGKERANRVAREVIRQLAHQDGSRWAGQFGHHLEAMQKVAEVWSTGGALELQPLAAMAEGFSGDIELTRTQTIMQGASHCDFRFSKRSQG